VGDVYKHRGKPDNQVVSGDLGDLGPTYTALANTSFDWHKTEEFLKTKIPKDMPLFAIPDLDDDKIVYGWYALPLDAEGKAAVENHEGIQSVDPSTFFQDFRAVPVSDQLQSNQEIDQAFSKNTVLATRDGKWEKQEKADTALVMDSQWK
jgi:hypothetical protein